MVAVDISFAQGYPNYGQLASDITLVIAKAGGGESGSFHQDSKWSYNCQNVRAKGLTLGSYFFNGPVDPRAAAEWYLSIIDYRAGDLTALDVESMGSMPRWSPGQALTFASRVKELTGVAPAIYMSSSVLFEDDWSALVALGCPLWVASYGANTGSPGKPPSIKWWAAWLLWQYTSVAGHAGFTGSVDTNLINDALLSEYLNQGEDDMSAQDVTEIKTALTGIQASLTAIEAREEQARSLPATQAGFRLLIAGAMNDIRHRQPTDTEYANYLNMLNEGATEANMRDFIAAHPDASLGDK